MHNLLASTLLVVATLGLGLSLDEITRGVHIITVKVEKALHLISVHMHFFAEGAGRICSSFECTELTQPDIFSFPHFILEH